MTPRSPDKNHIANVSRVISSKKRHKKLKVDETPLAGEEAESPKKSKKRKRKNSEAPHTNDRPEEEEIQQQPQKKKRKNKTEFTDPRDDSSLNSQSRKALEYAFLQMNKPSKWKFNKARQNWIIRNFWSSETLPETYFPLALKYLSKVQGGSRMKLVEEARTILQAKDVPPDTEKSPEKAVTIAESGTGTSPKPKPIPGPLTPGPLVESETTSSAVTKMSKTSALMQIKRTRAQKLLEVVSLNT